MAAVLLEWKALAKIVSAFSILENKKVKGDFIMENIFKDADFIDDSEKMYDFVRLTKEEFLSSYSYLTEDEYDSVEKFAKEFDLENITEDDLDENNYYHTGGFENYGQYEI